MTDTIVLFPLLLMFLPVLIFLLFIGFPVALATRVHWIVQLHFARLSPQPKWNYGWDGWRASWESN